MNPRVRSELGALFDVQGFVSGPWVHGHGLIVSNAWPEQSTTFFRHDRQWPKVRKICTSASVDIAQVQEECQDPWTALSLLLMIYVIMMDSIVLTIFIPEDLEVFKMKRGDGCYVSNAIHNPLGKLIFSTAILAGAPCVVRSSARALGSIE